jgi:hypothetical protein
MYFSNFFHVLSQDRRCKRSHKHTQIMPVFPGFFGLDAANWAIIPNAVKGISYINVTSKRLTNCGDISSSVDQTEEFCITDGNGNCPLFK